MVDTIGLILAVVVHAADIRDRAGAKLVLKEIGSKYPRLELIWADAGYSGKPLQDFVLEEYKIKLEIVPKPPRRVIVLEGVEPNPYPGFTVLKWRWVVERTFAWLGRWRRMSKDYEVLESTAVALIYAIMLRIMTSRLVRNGKPIREKRKNKLSTSKSIN